MKMKLIKNEKGLTLIEVIISLAILGIIVIVFLGAMAGASRAMFIADERATAESIARTQMEWVKNQEYDAEWDYTVDTSTCSSSTYPPHPSWWDPSNNSPPLLSNDYIGYSVEVIASESGLDVGLQKITITVFHNGDPIYTSGDFTLEGYKVDL